MNEFLSDLIVQQYSHMETVPVVGMKSDSDNKHLPPRSPIVLRDA